MLFIYIFVIISPLKLFWALDKCQLGDEVRKREGKLDSTGFSFHLLMSNILELAILWKYIAYILMVYDSMQLVRMEKFGVLVRGSWSALAVCCLRKVRYWCSMKLLPQLIQLKII